VEVVEQVSSRLPVPIQSLLQILYRYRLALEALQVEQQLARGLPRDQTLGLGVNQALSPTVEVLVLLMVKPPYLQVVVAAVPAAKLRRLHPAPDLPNPTLDQQARLVMEMVVVTTGLTPRFGILRRVLAEVAPAQRVKGPKNTNCLVLVVAERMQLRPGSPR
jgi:hypothetical protein